MSSKILNISETTGNGKVDKISRYNWEVHIGEKIRMSIPKQMLNIDNSYQREISKAEIEKLRRSWDNIKAQSILVGKRADGSLWVVDGQHRLKAALCRSDVDNLDCDVFVSEGPAHEAGIFKAVNADRKSLTSVQLHKAGVTNGDIVDVKIDDILNKYNVKLVSGENKKTGVSIRCIGDIKRVVRDYGFDVLETSIMYLSRIHNNGSKINGEVLKGTAYILTHYDIPNTESFDEAFGKCTPSKLQASISLVVSEQQKRGERMYALGVSKEINSHLRTNKIRLVKEQA